METPSVQFRLLPDGNWWQLMMSQETDQGQVRGKPLANAEISGASTDTSGLVCKQVNLQDHAINMWAWEGAPQVPEALWVGDSWGLQGLSLWCPPAPQWAGLQPSSSTLAQWRCSRFFWEIRLLFCLSAFFSVTEGQGSRHSGEVRGVTGAADDPV